MIRSPTLELPLAKIGLVVDPHDDTRMLHREILAPLVGELDEAEDGAEALAKAVEHPPDLVVAEARLPRIDGFALCSFLRADAHTSGTHIIIVTASALPSEVERAKRAGADDVIAKPCSPETIREHVRQLLLRSRELRQRSERARAPISSQLQRSQELLARAGQARKRIMSRAHRREATTMPPAAPPAVRCPSCDAALEYEHSQVGGVNQRFAEQWDYFTCGRCGTFQYRHRTRKLRQI